MRLSTGLVNKLMDTGSFRDIFSNFVLDVYSGSQPALPDNAPSGTMLCTVTLNGNSYTPETRSTGTMTLTGGASGTVNTVTVNSVDILGAAVSYTSDLTTTAAAVVAQINLNPANKLYVASNVGAIITITAVAGLGTLPNTYAIAGSLTTITASYAAMSGGVTAVNGLNFGSAVAGVISKPVSATWQGTVAVTGTAGWFRVREAGDAGSTYSATACRVDGSIGTSGADMNLGALGLTLGAPFQVPTASFALAQQ